MSRKGAHRSVAHIPRWVLFLWVLACVVLLRPTSLLAYFQFWSHALALLIGLSVGYTAAVRRNGKDMMRGGLRRFVTGKF